ncbi:hypothetical protein Zmor_009683 [Zophobas morio]|uniref:Uncharacterized protein n=1 Tax=Zophobas morio TaxID=2755281 RepID=A0AA38MIT8_9CUCU|nr:hypothetical protein Zmor_009683 [Zophobas morio]
MFLRFAHNRRQLNYTLVLINGMWWRRRTAVCRDKCDSNKLHNFLLLLWKERRDVTSSPEGFSTRRTLIKLHEGELEFLLQVGIFLAGISGALFRRTEMACFTVARAGRL